MLDFAAPLALAQAELRVAARKSRWFWLRVGLCGALLALLVAAYYPFLEQSSRLVAPTQMASMAAYFFTLYAIGTLAAVALVLPGLMAAAISGERDRRTLDDLLVSPLASAAIVLSKAAARGWQAGMLLAAGFGVLALSSLLGGSNLASLARLALVAGTTAWAVTGWSMAASVSSPRTRDALMWIYGWLFVVWALAPLAASLLLQRMIPLHAMPAWLAEVVMLAFSGLLCINPFVMYFGSSWLPRPDLAWSIMITVHAVIGALGLAWAIGRLRRPRTAEAPRRSLRAWWMRPLRRLPMGDHPMLWKEAARTTPGSLILSALLALTVWGFLAWYAAYCLTQGARWPDDFLPGVFAAAVILLCGLLVLVACRAATTVTLERERDTWVSLLATPLGAGEIMIAKLLGAINAFRWLLVLVATLGAAAVLVDTRMSLAVVVTAGVAAILLTAAAALGLSLSRLSRSTGRALMLTVAIGFTVGGGYLLLGLPLVIAVGREPPELVLAGVLPFLLMLPGIWAGAGAPPPEIVGAFATGLIGYAVAAAVLIGTHQREIDRIDDRLAPFPRPRPTTGSSAP